MAKRENWVRLDIAPFCMEVMKNRGNLEQWTLALAECLAYGRPEDSEFGALLMGEMDAYKAKKADAANARWKKSIQEMQSDAVHSGACKTMQCIAVHAGASEVMQSNANTSNDVMSCTVLSCTDSSLNQKSNGERDTREETQKPQGGSSGPDLDDRKADREARGAEKDHQESRAESGRTLQKTAEAEEVPRIEAGGLRAIDPTQYPTDTEKEPQAQVLRKRRGKSDLSEPQDPDFALWWSHYPRKEAKIPAFLAWEKNRKHLADIQSMIQTLKGQIIAHQWMDPDKRSFVPLPASYLNARRWTDEAPPAPKSYEQKMQDHVSDVDRFFGAPHQRRISGG